MRREASRVPGLSGLGSVCRWLAAALAVLGMLAHAGPAQASPPAQLSVSGVITNGVTAAPDGAYEFTILLYKDQVGGAPLWLEGPLTAAVKGGMFTLILGQTKPLPPAIFGAPLWLAVAVGQDPELPRKPLESVPYALRATVAEAVDCSGCVTLKQLAPDVLDGTVKATDLGAYAKAASLADVALSGNYGDLKGLPMVPKVGASCGTGLVMKGILADGSYECATSAVSAASLPKDGLDEISNGILTTQFTDNFPGSVNKPIPDGLAAGVTDSITVPDTGQPSKIWVSFTATNTDMSKVKVELFAPTVATPYLLYDGGKPGTALTANFNSDTPIISGSIDKDWLGKNMKGTWSLVVRDYLDNLPATEDGKFSWSLSMTSNSSKKVQATGDVGVTGNMAITGNTTITGNVQITGKLDIAGQLTASSAAQLLFPPGSRPMLYGEYIDGMGGANIQGVKYDTAAAVPYNDNALLHNAVTEIHWADAKGNLQLQRGTSQTYTTSDFSRQYVVVFIKNPTAAAVTRNVCAHYSSRSATHAASLALNGVAVWSLTTNAAGDNCANVVFPANTSSTLVLKTGAMYFASTYYHYRLYAGFGGGSLDLTGTGLEWDYDRYYAWMLGK